MNKYNYEMAFPSKDLGEIEVSVYTSNNVESLSNIKEGGLLKLSDDGKNIIATDNIVIRDIEVRTIEISAHEDGVESLLCLAENGAYVLLFGKGIKNAIKQMKEEQTYDS